MRQMRTTSTPPEPLPRLRSGHKHPPSHREEMRTMRHSPQPPTLTGPKRTGPGPSPSNTPPEGMHRMRSEHRPPRTPREEMRTMRHRTAPPAQPGPSTPQIPGPSPSNTPPEGMHRMRSEHRPPRTPREEMRTMRHRTAPPAQPGPSTPQIPGPLPPPTAGLQEPPQNRKNTGPGASPAPMTARNTAAARPCEDCGADISTRGNSAKRCDPCQADRTRRKARERARAARPPRHCPDCGADITARHPSAKRCEPCATERNRQRSRDRKQKQRENHQVAPERSTNHQVAPEREDPKPNRRLCTECEAPLTPENRSEQCSGCTRGTASGRSPIPGWKYTHDEEDPIIRLTAERDSRRALLSLTVGTRIIAEIDVHGWKTKVHAELIGIAPAAPPAPENPPGAPEPPETRQASPEDYHGPAHAQAQVLRRAEKADYDPLPTKAAPPTWTTATAARAEPAA